MRPMKALSSHRLIFLREMRGNSFSSFLTFAAVLPAEFLTKAKEVITPGATIIFTDRPVDPTTQSAAGFQILVAQKDKPSETTE